MAKTKVEFLGNENQKSYTIKVTNSKDEVAFIPVIDVRDGESARKKAAQLQKNANGFRGSKYMGRSYAGWGASYQVSHKSNL